MGRPRKSQTYRAIHKCLSVDRGEASEHPCARCGRTAREWAYLYNGNPELRTDGGARYSTDVWNCYAPMCSSCHKKWDHEKDPERHAAKCESARQRIITMNSDPKYHESRVANSRSNGLKVIQSMRDRDELQNWARQGGIARHQPKGNLK